MGPTRPGLTTRDDRTGSSTTDTALAGLRALLANPVTLHRTPARVAAPSPLVGEHTREVLEGLGYDRAAIEDLLSRGVAREARA